MARRNEILNVASRRPVTMPEGEWKYSRELYDVIFAHWKVRLKSLRKLLPEGLEPDLYMGEVWVSLAAFIVKNLRPHYLPAFPLVSDFCEINVRTYVVKNGKPGIYFLSLEADKAGSAFLGRLATGLNYYKSNIIHKPGYFESENSRKNFFLRLKYDQPEGVIRKTTLDKWLTERYIYFHESGGKIYSNEIRHPEWKLKPVAADQLSIIYRFDELLIDRQANIFHYSPGVKVLTWGNKREN